MQQVSFYQTVKNSIEKSVCQLVEKCYAANFRAIILAENLETQEFLNKLLWTYSRKQFIPHGSSLDPFPEKQPIYITHELENPNNSNVLILIGEAINKLEIEIKSGIASIKGGSSEIQSFERIINIYDLAEGNIEPTINQLALSFSQSDTKLMYFTQDEKGAWHKKDNSKKT